MMEDRGLHILNSKPPIGARQSGVALPPVPPHSKGFAIITVIIILSLMGIAAGIATSFMGRLVTSRRELTTEEELKALREALIGNPSKVTNQGRSDFGYLGTMGNLPATLQNLYIKGAQPSYAVDATARLGAGWVGPYVTPLLIEDISGLIVDSFANTYEYTTTEYTRADGEVVSARILSYGADKTPGTSDDKQVEILRRETRSTVSGYVTDSTGTLISGAPVTLYYPLGGSVNNVSTTTNAGGFFQFTNVPYGIRTLKAAGPGLRYVQGSALATGSNENNLTFTITNWGENAVSLTSMRLNYTLSPAFFEQAYVGSTLVFKYDEPFPLGQGGQRGMNNKLINFSSISVPGGGGVSPTRILVASDNVLLPNMVLYPRGGSLVIKYLNFVTTLSGPGSPVSLDGASFTVTFSDGSQFSFTAEEED
jgi:hypothetical protein